MLKKIMFIRYSVSSYKKRALRIYGITSTITAAMINIKIAPLITEENLKFLAV